MSDPLAVELANDDSVKRRRRAHHKVKTGCKACKMRREKCGEQKSKCIDCIRHSTDCVYVPAEKASREQPRESPYALRVPQSRVPASIPPPSPSRDLNLGDLELLHQYMTSTSIATAQLPEATSQMQTTVPQLAQTYHFVMHGILAMAAIHLSWLRPTQKARYTFLATKHHNAALPDFQSALQHRNEHNYRALILYSKGLVWCAFAWYETFCGQAQTAPHGSSSNWLPSWFHLLRGSCLVVESCKQWIETEFHMFPQPRGDVIELSKNPDDRRISTIKSQLIVVTASPICETVLSALQEAFGRAAMRHSNTPLRNAMNFWVGMLPNEYLDVLQKGVPWALVVMAHFCILVFRSETRWFMRGHATKLLRSILQRLPDPWRKYIQWPCEEIGF